MTSFNFGLVPMRFSKPGKNIITNRFGIRTCFRACRHIWSVLNGLSPIWTLDYKQGLWKNFPCRTVLGLIIRTLFLFHHPGYPADICNSWDPCSLASPLMYPVIVGAGHNSKLIAFSYIPWVLIGYYLLTRKQKHRLVYFFIFALALILELRAGHPQVTYYFLYVLGFWWIFDLYKAYKDKKLGDWAVITGWLLAAGIIALLANAQPYWSIFEYSKYSQRGGSVLHKTGGLNLNYAMAWSQGWGELLTLIIPGLYGGSSTQGTYWGPKPFTSGPHYLGAIAVLLFVIGII